MLIETKRIVCQEGTSQLVLDRFSRAGAIEQVEGFIDMSVCLKRVRRGDEEVLIIIRWESEAAWKRWETSEVHIAGHRAQRGKPKPEHIISSEMSMYEVKFAKGPSSPSSVIEQVEAEVEQV